MKKSLFCKSTEMQERLHKNHILEYLSSAGKRNAFTMICFQITTSCLRIAKAFYHIWSRMSIRFLKKIKKFNYLSRTEISPDVSVRISFSAVLTRSPPWLSRPIAMPSPSSAPKKRISLPSTMLFSVKYCRRDGTSSQRASSIWRRMR